MVAALSPIHDPCFEAPVRATRGRPNLAYGVEEAQEAWDGWGANCGPWALAAVAGLSLVDVRSMFPQFPHKPWTKETHMRAALQGLGLAWHETTSGWPSFGLVRVAWHGPWWDDADPFARFYRSHWIATHDSPDGRWVFDGNAIAAGGWITPQSWTAACIPRLLDPGATGAWRILDRFVIA